MIACHQNVSAQLSQGIPVKGNEVAILSLYLQSSAQYAAYSVLLYLGGRLCHFLVPPQFAETVLQQPEGIPDGLNAEQHYLVYGERIDEEDEDFQNWDSEFIIK